MGPKRDIVYFAIGFFTISVLLSVVRIITKNE